MKKEKGFTLIELSIVLVIIGLLIGGILAAQSMIETTKIQSFIGQVDQFDAAVANFQTKYNSLPGDSTAFPNPGDGNGTLTDGAGGTYGGGSYVNSFNYEVANFWTHLSLSGFTPDNVQYSNDGSAGIKAGVNTPIAKLGKSVSGGAGVVIFDEVPRPQLYYWFGDLSQLTGTTFNAGGGSTNQIGNAFTPIQVLAIDKKIDDGLNGLSLADRGAVFALQNPDIRTCYSGSSYATNNNVNCTVFIRVTRALGGTQ